MEFTTKDLQRISLALTAQINGRRDILRRGIGGARWHRMVQNQLGAGLRLRRQVDNEILVRQGALRGHVEALEGPEPDEHVTGMYPKFTVIKNATGEMAYGCFVLRPDRDPASRVALAAYADEVRAEYPLLARDLDGWLLDMAAEESPVPRPEPDR